MKILYLSHVSWDWIKQRPHFVAEELSKNNEITFVQSKIKNVNRVSNKETVKIVKIFTLPLRRFKIVSTINNFIARLIIHNYIKNTDLLWFTSPMRMADVSEKDLEGKIVVYDCMDDMPELYPSNCERIKILERQLLKRADVVFASSKYLSEKLQDRYFKRNITVVNNAVSNRLADLSLIESTKQIVKDEHVFTITYIGSIDTWMDFELLKKIAAKNPDLRICLWGPCHVNIPETTNIKYMGVAEYKCLPSIMEDSDILIMPFVVNELIKSVNPVKLYEYIYSGKPCIAPLYGESLQFSDFVCLYDNHDDCMKIIEDIKNGELKQKPLDDCRNFIRSNTWENRVDTMLSVIINTTERKTR